MARRVRVVIVGAGPAGLLTGAALASHADEVLLLDRDRLPREPVPREGVPQDRHWNHVHRHGVAAMETLLPGITAEAVAAGARSELRGLTVRRSVVEALVRRRVGALHSVRLWERTSALDLALDHRERRVRGVVVADLDQDATAELPADLVIDASGQHTRAPVWLARRGINTPEDRVRINATFVSREFTRATSSCDPLVTWHRQPDGRAGSAWRRSAVVMPVGDRWLVTLGGTHGIRPPTDLAGFTSYAADVCEPVGGLLSGRTTIGEVAVHRLPATITRRIESPADFPGCLVLVGDAWHTHDPLAESGLTAAALSVLALAELAERTSMDRLGDAWSKRVAARR